MRIFILDGAAMTDKAAAHEYLRRTLQLPNITAAASTHSPTASPDSTAIRMLSSHPPISCIKTWANTGL